MTQKRCMLSLEMGLRPAPGSDRWPCRVCGGSPTSEGYDPCWGFLPGVRFACCGHAEEYYRYIVTLTGRRFEGFQALQKYQQWFKSVEGQAALEVEQLGLTDLFGWTLPTLSRTRCGAHMVPSYECRHKYPPERMEP